MYNETFAILVSIKQKYCQKILSGDKKVELRKVPFKRDVSHVIIYESAGLKRVVGFFVVENIIKAKPSTVWRRYRNVCGITKRDFDRYYHNREVAIAIEIGEVSKLETPLSLDAFNIKTPPQSFCYLSFEEYSSLIA